MQEGAAERHGVPSGGAVALGFRQPRGSSSKMSSR